ncbi:MAG TPA: aldehyde dehydrogenase family protein [Pyrinomonadaceae bacterium]|jgi:succinate-semialdehyde dehydrogenase/glutarate-semialdehyde dehydrogenase
MSTKTLDRETGSPAEIVSLDPATGEEVGRVRVASAEEVARSVTVARRAQSDWAGRSFRERRTVVMRARALVLDEMEELARLISRETGKPVTEAFSTEITPTLDLMQFFARKTARLLRPERIGIGQYGLMGRSSRIVYKPLGVIGIISPWNFPWAIPLGEVVMALMAGNAVVLKPSELTPLTGLKIKEVFDRAGLPEGLLQVVSGGGETGAALIEARPDKIMFTGSVSTGKRVAEAASRHLIPFVLELGGKDPMIVFEDADLESAASAAVWGAFANSGQACASVERLYVHEKVAPQFIERVIARTRALRQDAGVKEETDIGSMSSERQLSIVEDHVKDALDSGARALTGGRRAPHLAGPFYEPTVLVDVTQQMKVMREETFGPVLPILTFKTEAEAVRLANDSVFGLTASVWTGNLARGRQIAESLEAGTIMVNEVLYTHGIAQTPWGGVKQSGLGRTHGRLGLLELVTPRHVHVNRLARIPDFWWFSYTPHAARLFRGFARRFATGNPLQTSLLLPDMVRRLFERRR